MVCMSPMKALRMPLMMECLMIFLLCPERIWEREAIRRYPQQMISMHNTKNFLVTCMMNTILKIW